MVFLSKRERGRGREEEVSLMTPKVGRESWLRLRLEAKGLEKVLVPILLVLTLLVASITYQATKKKSQ